jgi:hypothetical protein
MHFVVARFIANVYKECAMSDWQSIDSNLRRLATARAALDAEEASWLRAAEEAHVYRYFGCSSVVEYLEKVLHYTPKVAVERMRVANALAELPVTEAALRDGRLAFSAVRELTRVVTPETEEAWVDAARGKRVHQVERLVSGHRPGDWPDDPRSPDLETVPMRHDVSTSTAAKWRQLQRMLEDEVGAPMNDDELMAAVYERAVSAGGERDDGKSPTQVVLSVCEKCAAGQQHAGGKAFDVHPNAVERMLCDAQHVGHVDGLAPERAAQEPSPAVRRMVLLRDHHRCRVPWCRAARNIAVHHLEGRKGVDCHRPDKLITLCTFHHTQLHNGELVLRGPSAMEIEFVEIYARVGAAEQIARMFRPHVGARVEVR